MSEEKKISKAQLRAVAKYTKNNYDEIKLRVPKGRKELISKHAAAMGESVNSLINRLIDGEVGEDV